MPQILFPKVSPTQTWDFYYIFAFWEGKAMDWRCLQLGKSLCFLFGSAKDHKTRLPYWIIFSSRNSSVPYLRPGSNLEVITFGQSSDALSCCRGLGGFWGNWFYSVADASLGQMRNQTTAPFAEKPTSAVYSDYYFRACYVIGNKMQLIYC